MMIYNNWLLLVITNFCHLEFLVTRSPLERQQRQARNEAAILNHVLCSKGYRLFSELSLRAAPLRSLRTKVSLLHRKEGLVHETNTGLVMLLDVARTSPKRLPKFIKRQPLLTVLFTWVFVLSALIVSLLCIAATVIWPFSKSIYRRLVTKLAYSIMGRKLMHSQFHNLTVAEFSLFPEMIWLCIDFADVRVTVYGEESALEKFGKESCLITMSHLGEFDWLIGLMLADNHGFLTVKYA